MIQGKACVRVGPNLVRPARIAQVGDGLARAVLPRSHLPPPFPTALILAAAIAAPHRADARPQADSLLVPVQAEFYDQPIGGLDGEFGARKPGTCGYDDQHHTPGSASWSITPGMLADTLSYSKDLGKKIPRGGSAACNSASIEKWFNPVYASGTACRELPFSQQADSLGLARMRYRNSLFFPIDSLAPADQLEDTNDFKAARGLPPGYTGVQQLTYPRELSGKHNFNWCMEINAQFRYRGHEAFFFSGDDDVWVFLDNKMIVDLGGIHGEAPSGIIEIDSLPFIAKREGEAFDFDLYFCERRPGGSGFSMTTTLDLKPAVFQDLEIVGRDAQLLDPKAPVVGSTRLCALPRFTQSVCGNGGKPPPGPFYPATWSLKGAVIAKDSTCITLDPDELPINKRVSLAAKAEGKTAHLNLQVVKANRAVALILKGNGRLESVEVPLDSRSDSLEAPARLDFPFAGVGRSDSVFAADFQKARRMLSLQLAEAEKGPSGYSGLDTGKGLFSQTIQGNLLSYPLILMDSITPALRRAAWQANPQRGDLYLDFVPSEKMAAGFPADVGLIFKDKRGAAWRMDLAGASPVAAGLDSFRVAFPAGANLRPQDIDSVSFSEAESDAEGNHAAADFIALPAPGWSAEAGQAAAVRLESNPVKGESFTPIPTPFSLVLIDKLGSPYDASGDNPGLAQSQGPILDIRSTERLERVDVSVFTNLGAPVDRSHHDFTDAEWEHLLRESATDTALARVLWYPSSGGAKLGTGVYIIKGSVTTKRSFTQDAGGRWHEKNPARKYFGPLLFGYLRK